MERLPSIPIPIHQHFDELFHEFSSYLKDGFVPNEISEDEWTTHFDFVGSVIKAWKDVPPPSSSRRAQAVRTCFHESRRADVYVITKNAESIWQTIVGAHLDGYLLDVVLESGPCPSKKWEKIIYSPVKEWPTPPTRTSPPVLHLSTLSSSSLSSTLPPVSPRPLLGSSSSSEEDLYPVPQPAPPLTPIAAAPVAQIPSSAPAPAAPSATLPGALSFSPVFKAKAFKLRDFLPSFANSSDDGERETVVKNGKLMVKSTKARVVSSHSWMVAMSGLSRHLFKLHTQGLEPSFSPSDFSLYVDLVLNFFQVYSAESVISFDIEFRKWRRYYGLPWCTDNPYFRLTLLKPKVTSTLPSGSPSPSAPPSKTGFCRDFNKGSCKRSHCIFPHVCAWCKQSGHALSECKTAPSGGH